MEGRRFRLRSGDWVLVRPLRREDAPALVAAVEELSAQARYQRFHSGIPRLSEQMVDFLTDIDHHDHEALVAVPPGSPGVIVGVARFVRDPDHPDTAELAIAVLDSWQRRGLGTLLLRRLAHRAGEVGIRWFTAQILADNQPTLGLMHRMGEVDMTEDGPMVTARVDAAGWPDEAPGAASLLRILADANVVLVPRLMRVLLELSAGLTRTLTVPVTSLLDRSRKRDG